MKSLILRFNTMRGYKATVDTGGQPNNASGCTGKALTVLNGCLVCCSIGLWLASPNGSFGAEINPVTRGRWPLIQERAYNVVATGQNAYVLCDRVGLKSYNMSDPAHPKELGTYKPNPNSLAGGNSIEWEPLNCRRRFGWFPNN